MELRGNKRGALKRGTALMLTLALLLCLIPAFSAGAVQAGSTVRVQLSSLGSPVSLQLTLFGIYTVNTAGGTQLSSGSTVKVNMNMQNGSFTLVTGQKNYSLGTSFTLCRKSASEGCGVKIAQSKSPQNLYPADLTFSSVQSGGSVKMTVTASMYLEDYLLGVLPNEMGEGYQQEALRAQAVVCRTYALRKMRDNAGLTYDVVDTASDQVYRGTPSSSGKCAQAVRDTEGLALVWDGSWAATFYTSSNGGQTESARNAWGSKNYSYLTVKDDPYDLASNAKAASFQVSRGGTQPSQALQTLLTDRLHQLYGSGTYLTGVRDVKCVSPRYPSPSRLYTRVVFYVTYDQGTVHRDGQLSFDIFNELEGPLGMSLSSGDSELWSVESTSSGFTVTARRWGHGIGLSQNGANQMAKSGMTCGSILDFYFPGCTLATCAYTDSPRPQNTVDPEEISRLTQLSARVTTSSGSLNLRANASTSAAVLCTIPRNTVIRVLEKGKSWSRVTYNSHTGYVMNSYLTFVAEPSAAPTASPTAAPRPGEQREGTVTTSGGSLNLRSSPGGAVLLSIPRGTVIPLLGEKSGWYQTAYRGVTGYVSASYITEKVSAPTAAPAVTPAPAATPAPASQRTFTALVNTVSGSLNLRAKASSSSSILRTIPKGAEVRVLDQGSEWSQVSYLTKEGYVMSKYLLFPLTEEEAAPTPGVDPAPSAVSGYAVVLTVNGSLNLRREADASAEILTTVPRYTRVEVLEKGELWCRFTWKGYTGYGMTAYLAFETGVTPRPNTTLPPSGAPVDRTMVTLVNPLTALVASANGSLNLRAGCSTDSRMLCEMPRYERLIVLAVGNDWCKVQYRNWTGYCMKKYLTFVNE